MKFFTREGVLFCTEAANFEEIWSNYKPDGSFQFMSMGSALMACNKLRCRKPGF